GQLILERRGLKPEEAKYRKAVDYNAGEHQVAYRIMLRGRNDSTLNVGGGVDRRQSFEDWATEYQLPEPLRTRESDQPRPGEYIKIVAINRATGYTGTARVQLKSAGDPNKNSTTLLDVEVPTITLLPPNLKIWAERDYTVEHGLTKGEERNYTIGNEGASLTSDTSIRVYTEWLDEEGRPLPDELGENSGKQYGLTGRLAKVVGANQLRGTAIGDDMAEFAIAPGRNTQVLRLSGQTSNTEHFYIHVIGKPKDQECVAGSNCPSFDVVSSQAELAGRPKLLTPFLTPLWDENESWKEYAAYKKTLEELEEALPEGGELSEADKPNKPLPSYAWQYRPEYQFSQFDFEVDGIERTYTDENGDEQRIDILDLDNPAIASSDDYITALYSLISNEFDALTPIDGAQELVFALGEQEQRIILGEDQSIRFSDVESLANLDSEDFLSMRLYSNNDAGNVLWEFAFDYIYLQVQEKANDLNEYSKYTYFVSADDPTVELSAVVLGQNAKVEDDEIIRGIWSVDGNGTASAEPSIQSSPFGNFSTKVTMPRTANSRAYIKLEVSELDTEAIFEKEILVIPGKANGISLNLTGTAVAQGKGDLIVNATITDAHGNLVLDGTAVDFSIEGSAIVIESDTYTVGGVASAKLAGGRTTGGVNKIIVEAEDISSSTSFDVNELPINVIGLPELVDVNSDQTITIKSEPDVYVDVYSTIGNVKYNQLKTDESGNLNVVWSPGSIAGPSNLIFSTSSNNKLVRSVAVVAADVNGLSADEKLFMAQTSEGSIPNSISEISTYRQRTLSLSGTQGESSSVTIGTNYEPNRSPIIVVQPSQQYSSAGSINVNTNTHLISYLGGRVDLGYKLTAPEGQNLLSVDGLNATNPVFISTVKPNAQAQGRLFRFGDLIRAEIEESTLEVTVNTDSGIENFEVDSLNIGEWNDISITLNQGSLVVELNQTVRTFTLSGSYLPAANTSLLVGTSLSAEFADFRLYDLATQPLLTIDGSMESKDITYDQNGLAEIVINTSGAPTNGLQKVGFQVGSTTDYLVSVSDAEVINTEVKVASLLSRDAAETEVTSLLSGRSEFKNSFYTTQKLQSYLEVDDVLLAESKLSRRLNLALNTIPTLYSTGVLRDSIQSLSAYIDSNTANAEFIEATEDIIFEAVQAAIKGDRTALDKLETPLTVLAELIEIDLPAAGYLSSSVKSKQDFQAWLNIFSTPADGWIGLEVPHPNVNNHQCSTIPKPINADSPYALPVTPCRVSGAIMSDWITQLAIEDSEYSVKPKLFVNYLHELYHGLPYADSLLRLGLFRSIDTVALNPNLFSTNLQHANAGATALLKPLKWLGKLGSKGMRNYAYFLSGKSNHRTKPVMMLFIQGYLLDRMSDDGACEGISGCEKITDRDVKREISKKIAKVNSIISGIGRLKVDGITGQQEFNCTMAAFSHGDMFELQMIAFYHALFEAGLDEYEIIGVEKESKIELRHQPRKPEAKARVYDKFTRRTDIVLKGSFEGERGNFVEVKSLQAARYQDVKSNSLTDKQITGKFAQKFPQWSLNKAKSRKYHKQFFLDNVARTPVTIPGGFFGDDKEQQFANDFSWWFQDWKPRYKDDKTRRGVFVKGFDTGYPPRAKDVEAAKNKLYLVPTESGTYSRTVGLETLKNSLANDRWYTHPTTGKAQQLPAVGEASRVRLFTIASAIREISQETGKDIKGVFDVPFEYEALLFQFENESQLVQDILDGLDEVDILNLPVEEWYSSFQEELADFSNPFSFRECDP
ncbi:MAG: hypothetical protein ACI9SP_004731, partial [Arenicella sp.]